MASKIPNEPEQSVTDEQLYLRRREFLKNSALFAGVSAGLGGGLWWLTSRGRVARVKPPVEPALALSSADAGVRALEIAKREAMAGGEAPTPYEDVTTYNNFYEFGLDKADPARERAAR